MDELNFDNSFVRALPSDPVTLNIPRQIHAACYTRIDPTPVEAPTLLAWSDSTGKLLGLARPTSTTGQTPDVLGGNRLLPGMTPYAARYGGHQFGQWAGQLGDGRAITLGEVLNAEGQRFELQLKGAGKTPYARSADGRAVLRSSVREFLCSEAMHHLGVPTTRALSLVATGETVVRDMFYDGHPKEEPGAVVCRVAPSFVRFGNFEIHAAHGEDSELKLLADYVLKTHFPEIIQQYEKEGATYARWFEEICRRTAVMVAEWMRVGFVHGVMNTDNMSILGLTIDYGPYGWLEGFDPLWTPNTTDADSRRYCFGKQPQVALWNLEQLANALAPLIQDNSALKYGLDVFTNTYEQRSRRLLANKLGLLSLDESDDEILDELFGLLQLAETDMTIFFRNLATLPVDEDAESISDERLVAPLRPSFYTIATETGDGALSPMHMGALTRWLRRYIVRTQREDQPALQRTAKMNRSNPKYVLRNYLTQLAIEGLEHGDTSVIERLMLTMQHPYDEQPEHDELANRRPEWARHKAGCSALSCSS